MNINWKLVGIIGTIGSSAISATGLGIMLGGGYMTMDYNNLDLDNPKIIKVGVGPFNYTPPLKLKPGFADF